MITFQIPDILQASVESYGIRLTLYDIEKRMVRSLSGSHDGAGMYTVRWDGRDAQGRSVSSGLYILELEAREFTQTKKILVIR
jgi:flagellar hook assembly protein FlgD